ncbi:hypothetical protein [Luteimonas sp. 3794]|uniref:hypothetical protein n=1 Tax=Luteimonas sp. 3794 TaxID=2817730 RepID=UPI00285FBA1F|nr:hypothetical protein [Luteimonas sp. 3794]MDR6992861.1 hypothetical protein [Luteimonas sp. 3794]
MKGTLIAALAVVALAMAPKIASAQSVSIACEPSNFCFSDAQGVSYDTISWSANTFNTGAIFPANCTNKSFCRFYCPTRQGFINMTVNYSLGGQVVGSASSQVRCTAQDI